MSDRIALTKHIFTGATSIKTFNRSCLSHNSLHLALALRSNHRCFKTQLLCGPTLAPVNWPHCIFLNKFGALLFSSSTTMGFRQTVLSQADNLKRDPDENVTAFPRSLLFEIFRSLTPSCTLLTQHSRYIQSFLFLLLLSASFHFPGTFVLEISAPARICYLRDYGPWSHSSILLCGLIM